MLKILPASWRVSSFAFLLAPLRTPLLASLLAYMVQLVFSFCSLFEIAKFKKRITDNLVPVLLDMFSEEFSVGKKFLNLKF